MSSSSPDVQLCANAVTTFVDYTREFLDAMSDTFPECDVTASLKGKFKATVDGPPLVAEPARDFLIKSFHEAMEEKYDLVDAKDATLFNAANVQLLVDLDMQQKFSDPSVDDETRAAIWDYLSLLTQQSRLWSFYTRVPDKMLGTIAGVASDVSKALEEGGGDLSKIDLAAMSSQVMQKLDPDDIQRFTQTILGDAKCMDNMAAMLSGALGTDAGALTNMFNNPQIAAVLGQLGNQGK